MPITADYQYVKATTGTEQPGSDQARNVVVLSLGADCLTTPGASIVGGQALFALEFATRIAASHPTTLVTLWFEEMRERADPAKYPFDLIEIPLHGASHTAVTLWENLNRVVEGCAKSVPFELYEGAVVLSVYWLSGAMIMKPGYSKPLLWVHTHSSFAHQNARTAESRLATEYVMDRNRFEKRIMSRIDYCLCTCVFETETVKKRFEFPEHRILHLPRCVDQEIFRPHIPREDLPTWDVLYAGRLDERKGIYDIPPILSRLSGNRRIRVAVVGGSQEQSKQYATWLHATYPNLARRHQIDFLPAIDHNLLPRFFAQSRLLLVPSHYEVFGNIVMEGVACGIPVVAASVGGVPDLIRSQDEGALFPRQDLDAAAARIDALLSQDNEWYEPRVGRRPVGSSWPHLLHTFRELYA